MIIEYTATKPYKLPWVLAFLFLSNMVLSQSISQEKMADLAFMTGKWIGTSTSYKDGAITNQVPAYQHIAYDLNNTILVIQLNSETLQLHTIIRYDEKDETYYYFPFSKRGVSQLAAEFVDGKLMVKANEKTRYIFERTGENSFREYGERLTNGQWVKFFEDTFTDTE